MELPNETLQEISHIGLSNLSGIHFCNRALWIEIKRLKSFRTINHNQNIKECNVELISLDNRKFLIFKFA